MSTSGYQLNSHGELQTPEDNSELVLCRYCDLLQHLPELQPGEEAHCSQCGHQLDSRHPQPILRPILFASSALFMLVLANLFPFIQLFAAGSQHQMNFFDTSSVLFAVHHPALAILVWLLIQAIPAFCMMAVIYLKLGMIMSLPGRMWVARVLFMLKPWSMVDIFLIGLLVSFVKLVSSADISLGLSFWAFCLFCLLHLRTFQVIDRREMWARIGVNPKPLLTAKAGLPGVSQRLKVCHCCTALVPLQQMHCSRCGSQVHVRIPASIQKTLALLTTAAILYIPANLYPIMVTVSVGQRTESTIVTGIQLLWLDGAYPVAIIIAIASVVIPLFKIVILFWLCYLALQPQSDRQDISTWVFRWVDWIGRWSMVDVLVVAILAALVRFDLLMSVYPGPAAVIFATVVITTMLAALSFDPRLLWDQSNENEADMQQATAKEIL
ncbi:PqiA/YebS family transporter subunit [Alkalimonas collagenimarina]|uniref:PqiA/YebS family transporter subunit n=1 Tax=Alkalimonas collagenimarina TaxID=400390 RepID=A0ABT9GX31_9GAMM|nr:PqiA/YebS family transporter subunit [Alkalimonas collagenimarina]MDP4535523.1 PqiA/YebS family transporter subunit [Alkalimonas collagenimarina]